MPFIYITLQLESQTTFGDLRVFVSPLSFYYSKYVPQTTFGDLLFAGSVTGDNLLYTKHNTTSNAHGYGV